MSYIVTNMKRRRRCHHIAGSHHHVPPSWSRSTACLQRLEGTRPVLWRSWSVQRAHYYSSCFIFSMTQCRVLRNITPSEYCPFPLHFVKYETRRIIISFLLLHYTMAEVCHFDVNMSFKQFTTAMDSYAATNPWWPWMTFQTSAAT